MMLTAENLVKTFPGVRALDGATLRLAGGSSATPSVRGITCICR